MIARRDEEKGGERWAAVWAFALALFTVCFVLGFGYRYLDDVARDRPGTFTSRFIEEATGAYTAMALFVAIVGFSRRYPIDWKRWRETIPVHLVALVVFSIVHTSLNWVTRIIAFAALGLGRYDYGAMPVRYAMEFGNDAIAYMTMLALITAYRYYRALRDRELRAVQLERSLAQAELQNLRLQLQPHFLFNALNTISSTMYSDPRAADRMIGELSELLRLSLRTTHTQEVPLADELAVLGQYVGIMEGRFGDRLRVRVDVPAELQHALVPSLILQPLVENAVRHGGAGKRGRGEVTVSASHADGGAAPALRLEVRDDGPGVADGASLDRGGVGLRATAERLRLLYGSAGRFTAGNVRGGGFAVTIEIPRH
jgi:signal transduction histidine kinase